MLVRVATLYEDNGRPLPRHRAIMKRPEFVGRLTLTEEHDRELRRSVRSAHLRQPDSTGDVLPQLRDAVVLWIGDGRITITGFVTNEVDNISTAQSWYIELCDVSEGGVAAAQTTP